MEHLFYFCTVKQKYAMKTKVNNKNIELDTKGFLDGFFSVFGLSDILLDEAVDIANTPSSEKIKKDIGRVNKGYKEALESLSNRLALPS